MDSVGEVELRFVGLTEDAGAQLAQDFLAWWASTQPPRVPGRSGAPLARTTDAGPEVVGVLVTLDSGFARLTFATALAAWLDTRLSNVTVKLTASGGTAELRSGIGARDIDSVLRSLGPPDSEFDDDWAYWQEVEDQRREEADPTSMPITIYLSDEETHERVEAALISALTVAGLRLLRPGAPEYGSYFRKMWAVAKDAARSSAAREATLVAAHAADTRLVLAQDAAVTAALLQNLGPVLGALQPTKDAVIRAGALLIVKVDWVVNVYQLTAAQQAVLDHSPVLARAPHEIVAALNLTPEDRRGEGPPAPG